ncbi:MAG: phosphoglucosamine mutase [Candidatus Bathyarchaeia archaeon]
MSQERRLFGTNGIRGIVNEDLTPEFVINIGAAIGTFFEHKRLLVGYDGRTSNIMFAHAVTSGLTATGCDVYNVGMAPTPAIQYAVRKHNMDGAVIITASHNPPEYNGIKVTGNDGIEISREEEIKIENIFFDKRFSLAEWKKIGQTYALNGIINEYIEAIKTHVNTEAIQKKHLHVVVDPGNGAGGLAAPQLLRDLGCKITALNANVDGTFPNRPSEPRVENLGDLAVAVKALHADLGVAFDGDADRSVFVDEEGEIHAGDRTFALIEKYFLLKNKGATVVTPVSSSYLVKEIADVHGGEVVWTKVGSTIVSQTMKKLKAKLGGEENGGVFYGPHQAVRDGAMTTALILDIMAKTGKKLSTLLGELPRYFIEKDKIECPNKLKEPLLMAFTELMQKYKPDTTDGVKLWFEDKSSILIRPSGTEPIFRFYAEAKTRQKAEQLVRKHKAQLVQLMKKIKT